MKSILSVAFNVQLQIIGTGEEKDRKVWVRNKGIPGWASSLHFSTQLVGVKNASESLFNFLENIEAVPAHNDADNQEAANNFKLQLLNRVDGKRIDELFHSACVNGETKTHFVVDRMSVTVKVNYQYPIYYSSQKFKATLDFGKLVALQITEELPIDEIFTALESVGQSTAFFAYHLDKRGAPIDAFVQFMDATKPNMTRTLTLAVV